MGKKNISKKIPLRFYKKIAELMPIACIDCLLEADGKFFLFKRAYEPAKAKWWLFGGRILKGERIYSAVKRKAKEEIGIDVKIKKMIGTYEVFLEKNRFGSPSHSVAVCFLVEPKNKNFSIRLSDEYTGFKTITGTQKGLHPYIKNVLKDVA